jgi:hypothetical protein
MAGPVLGRTRDSADKGCGTTCSGFEVLRITLITPIGHLSRNRSNPLAKSAPRILPRCGFRPEFEKVTSIAFS